VGCELFEPQPLYIIMIVQLCRTIVQLYIIKLLHNFPSNLDYNWSIPIGSVDDNKVKFILQIAPITYVSDKD